MPKIPSRLKEERYQLFNESCFEIFKRIPDKSIDLVLCDPPYGTTACKWDSIIPLEHMWKELKRIGTTFVLTASQPFTSVLVMSNLAMFKYEVIWEKSHPSGFAMVKSRPLKYHESILIFGMSNPVYNPQKWKGEKSHSVGNQLGNRTGSKSNPNLIQTTKDYPELKNPKSVIKISNPRIKNQHPTQKPIALMEYLIKTYTNENDLVLDFAMGSGTTGVACGNLNRRFIGCDNDTEHGYFETAEKRISEAYKRS